MSLKATASQVVPVMQRGPNTAQRSHVNFHNRNTTPYNSQTTHSHLHMLQEPDSPSSYTIHKKTSGSVRLVYENFNGFTPWYPTNDKITLAKTFLKHVAADCYIGVECRAQWDMLRPTQQLTSIFQSTVPVKAITSFNKGEAVTRAQEGGTALIMFDRMASLSARSHRDHLGRWCWTTFQGKNNSTTRLMVAYRPCISKHSSLHTVYAQQRRYFRRNGDNRCPVIIFREDIDKILTKWTAKGDKIILFIDANENIAKGKMRQLLKKHNMRDLVQSYTGQPGPATFHAGTNQIDGCFGTPDVDCHHAEFLPLNSIMGDHRGIIIDIPEQVLYGEQKLKIARPQGRRLQCSRSAIWNKYNNKLTQNLILYKVPQKIQQLCSRYYFTHPKEGDILQETIDRVKKESMVHAEKKCRKFGMGAVPYSPAVLIWKNRRDVWTLVIQYLKGRTINRAIINRKAKKFGIVAPLNCTLSSATTYKKKCADEFERLRPLAGKYRCQFLRKLANEAEESGDKNKSTEI